MRTYLSQQAVYILEVTFWNKEETTLIKYYNFLEAQKAVQEFLESEVVLELKVSECTNTIVHVKPLVEA